MVQYIYTLGAAGERRKVTELDRTVEYTYDNLYRLISETITEGEKTTVYTYAYDNVSNRILKTVDGKETVYTYNSLNQLVSDSETTYEYDLNGNLIRVVGLTNSALYEYNAENRLVKATVQSGNNVVVETYTYDYLGNRTSKTTNTNGSVEFVKYLNDNSSLTNVLAEIDEIGTAKCFYTIGADLISQEQDGNVSVYLYDGHGSVVGLANMNGKVTDTYKYDAFGNLIKSTGSTANNYLYCGEQFDGTTGLYYLRARYMDTYTGRFISQDSYAGSINDPTSLHKYLYANSNPVMYTDPSGYCVAALPSPLEIANIKSILTIGKILLGLLCSVASVYISQRIVPELLVTAAVQMSNIAEYLRNTIIDNAISEISSNIKSLVLLRNIQILYASLLQQVMTWVSTKGKTNNDYDNKYARHHIVPQGMDETKFTRVILSLAGINCYSYSILSPNIVVIKYSTHYALHSNNRLYTETVNSVIFAAYFNSYDDGYAKQVASVHLALASLKGLITAIDLIIA